VALALAIKKVITSKALVQKYDWTSTDAHGNSIKGPGEYIFVSGIFEKESDLITPIKDYDTTLSYLAFVASDWINDTGGNRDIYIDFNLNLQVHALEGKVAELTEIAWKALDAANRANQRMDRADARALVQSAMFWGIAGVTYGTVFGAR
jgi:hypothetical protein